MAFTIGAVQNLSTSQKLTPQMQHAIKILAMSAQELSQEVVQKVQSNPMLVDLGEDDFLDETLLDADDDFYQDNANVSTDSANTDGDSDEFDAPDSAEKLEDLRFDDDATDTDWGEICPDWQDGWAERGEFDGEQGFGEGHQSVQEYVRWQMQLKNLSDSDWQICEYLLDAMDDEGFVRISIEEVHKSLYNQAMFYGYECAEIDEIRTVLKRIQACDPVGVGARDLVECLQIQLSHINADPAIKEVAMQLLAQYEKVLAGNLLGFNKEEFMQAMALIRTLRYSPASAFVAPEPEPSAPDVLVSAHNDDWLVRLNPATLPKLGIQQDYANLIKPKDDSADNVYLKEQLQDAKLFIKSIDERNQNLLKVASAIIKKQHDFLHKGAEFMAPLTLKEIADTVGVHESTVSRLTTNKTMLTPQGLFDLKYFFSAKLSSDDGDISATAICAHIESMVKQEDPMRPLSDSALTQMLEQKGISVARRTVAKYRESLGILSSSARRRHF